MFTPYPAITQSDPMQQMLGQAMGGYKPNQLGAGVTLGNPEAQQDYIAQLAQALADGAAGEKMVGQAGAMGDSGWIDNSGWVGVLERVVNKYASGKMDAKGRALQADAETRRMTAQEQLDERKAKREAERASAARAVEIQAQIDAYNKNDPALDAALGIKREKPSAPDYVLTDMQDGTKAWIQKPGTGAQPQQRNTPNADAGFDLVRDAVEWQESRGNPNAVSPKGAKGRMQTMPGTLRDPGYGVTPARDESDAEMTRVGNEYLSKMVEKYGTEGGLAAYNWGPGNWEKALQASGGDPQRALAMAPKETQEYVPSVLGRAQGGTNEQYVSNATVNTAGVIPIPGSGTKKEEKPSTIQQRRRDLRELQASGQKVTQGMADHYMLHGKMPDAPAPAAQGAGGMSVEKGNKVGLLKNAIRSAQEWHAMVAEKDAAGNFTGGYNNTAAMSSEAKVALNNAIRAKLRAESGASISPDELEGEVERYSARILGGDTTDLGAANNLLNDLATQIKSLVGSGKSGGSGHQVGQIIEKGGKKYRVVGGDPNDPDVEEVR